MIYEGLQKGFSEDNLNDIISKESCNYDSQIDDIIFPKQAKMIVNYILWRFSRTSTKNTVVTYGDVSSNILAKYKTNIASNAQFKTNKKGIPYENKAVGGYADNINEFCAKYSLPFITAKIVSIEQQKTGKKIPEIGFFKSLNSYKDVYNYNLPNSMSALSNVEKEKIINDINEKISENFDKIVETFKILNDKKYWIHSDSEDAKPLTEEDKKIINELESETLTETEKYYIVKRRIGQSKLKQQKIIEIGCCEICGLKTSELLIASHIKPWAASTNEEKLDSENVLLLCSTHDALFDKGFISFDVNGNIVISNKLSEEEQALLNIHDESRVKITSDKKAKYLQYHYKNIFENNH